MSTSYLLLLVSGSVQLLQTTCHITMLWMNTSHIKIPLDSKIIQIQHRYRNNIILRFSKNCPNPLNTQNWMNSTSSCDERSVNSRYQPCVLKPPESPFAKLCQIVKEEGFYNQILVSNVYHPFTVSSELLKYTLSSCAVSAWKSGDHQDHKVQVEYKS